ncbi:hypothetical protein H2136_08490 [Aeromonas hydrophila]|uniref:Uncharacterized protein n=1 Tax=Aeromonas hydrophila TaxID=644 RepID=A0A926FJS9_AERHY|nr:hypothetical protein [Aeromonas hydrophila]
MQQHAFDRAARHEAGDGEDEQGDTEKRQDDQNVRRKNTTAWWNLVLVVLLWPVTSGDGPVLPGITHWIAGY